MDSRTSKPYVDFVKCCNCECSCVSITASSGTWLRSVKRKLDEFEDNRFVLSGFDYPNVARVEFENECVALREHVSSQQQTIQELYEELEEERNASASAANEAMSMILRLQREKAEIQMESKQFKRFAEEKMAHDQQELLVYDDLLYKREQVIQSLTCEVQAYKHRMLSFGLTEAEAEGEKGFHSRNQSFAENLDAQYELPMYDYPPLKCNLNESHFASEIDNDVAEKYAFGETPRNREHLKNLEYRICQLERSPSTNQLEGGDYSGSKNILEKVIVGQSPRRSRHSRMLSTDSFNSLTESPRLNASFKKAEYFSHTDENSSKKFDNSSENGDDICDRVCTVDSIHNGVSKPSVLICEDNVNTLQDPMNLGDLEGPDIKKLYTRLQVLEADRESMKQTIMSMRTDKAQLVLLKEIAQQLCKEMSPERNMPVKKSVFKRTFSFVGMLKWVVSFMFWRKTARRSKYMCGLSANNVGLLLLLDKGPRTRQWRCLTSTQV